MKAALRVQDEGENKDERKVDKSKEQKGRWNRRLEVKIESEKENFEHEEKGKLPRRLQKVKSEEQRRRARIERMTR